ncbi:MAG: PEP-utilizing enzyme [bacterium]|nr:PEP-utilizing enzyme [bacterium]
MKKEDFKILRTRKYYPWPADWSIEVHSSAEAREICGQSFANIYFLHDKVFVTALYPTNELKKIGNSILQKIMNDDKYISGINIEQQKRGEDLKRLALETIGAINSQTNLSFDELNNFSLNIKRSWLKYNNLELSWHIGAESLKYYINEEISKSDFVLSDSVFQLLAAPCENSFSANEEIDTLKSAIKILGNGSKIDHEINRLVRKYYWIPFGYDGPTFYDEEHYRKVLKDLVGRGLQSVSSRLSDLKSTKNKLLKNKEELFKKYKIGKSVQRLLGDLIIMTMMADNRKEYTAYVHIAYDKLLDRYGESLGIDKVKLKYLDINEIIDNCNQEDSIENIYKQRKNSFLVGVENHIKFIDTGLKAKEFNTLIEESGPVELIQGVVASKGKRDVVRGRARLLFVPDDLSKVENGDIVVSPMTTPQFTSAVRKASAVVTDEGGITCHAAIISRELSILCIIGTKKATKILKDGDLIEVDASTGMVKIIEKAK